jgi:putative addiction module component (TIGR02574 family)
MSTHVTELTDKALILSPAERAQLAQQLWDSLDESARRCSPEEELEILGEAKRRDEEVTRGVVQPRSHSEVMEAARRALP